MIYSNPNGVPSIVVEEGQQFTLRARDAHKSGLSVARVRPLTTAALLTLAGRAPANAPRLSDPKAFEHIDSTEGLVSLSTLDAEGKIDGYSVGFISGLLQSFNPHEAALPRSVKRYIPLTGEKDCGCGGKKSKANDISRYAALPAHISEEQMLAAKTHRIVSATVPEFLVNFHVYELFVRLGDVIVQKNATLIIDQDISFAIADNVLGYQGSRIIQRADILTLDITGTLRGNIRKLAHTVSDVVKVDWKALALEAVDKP